MLEQTSQRQGLLLGVSQSVRVRALKNNEKKRNEIQIEKTTTMWLKQRCNELFDN